MSHYYDTVTVVTRPTATQDPASGNDTYDWDTADDFDTPASVQPISSTENTRDEDVTITRWRLFCPVVALTAKDRVVWDSQTFEVDGDVGLWKRLGSPHHLEAVLKRVGDQ